jgi:hypothetical protein
MTNRSRLLGALTNPRPTTVTIAIRPLSVWDGGGCRSDLGLKKTKIFLHEGLDS